MARLSCVIRFFHNKMWYFIPMASRFSSIPYKPSDLILGSGTLFGIKRACGMIPGAEEACNVPPQISQCNGGNCNHLPHVIAG